MLKKWKASPLAWLILVGAASVGTTIVIDLKTRAIKQHTIEIEQETRDLAGLLRELRRSELERVRSELEMLRAVSPCLCVSQGRPTQ